MEKSFIIEKIIPAFIFLILWLDGWIYLFLLIPFLYMFLIEKKDIDSLGFQKKGIKDSILLGKAIAIVSIILYLPILMFYLPLFRTLYELTVYDVFTDVLWYPLYEEVAYRAFVLTHYADFDTPAFSKRNLI
ncbi:MAG: hypothetical protein ACTSYO_09860, partial [Candidatus Ranarchaeia archaeon]